MYRYVLRKVLNCRYVDKNNLHFSIFVYPNVLLLPTIKVQQ